MGSKIPIMGIEASRITKRITKKTSMLDALFSKTQQRVLSLLTGMPDRRFFQKEIIEASKIGSGAVQRELVKLVDAGLVQVESEGNLKRYQINQQAPVFEELKSIFEKTVGLALPLRTALKPMEKRISLAFVYGSVAKGGDRAASDIDLLVVSDDLSLSDLYERLMPVERRLGRTLNLTLYTRAEYEREKQFSFLKSVLAGKRIILIDENSDSGSRYEIG